MQQLAQLDRPAQILLAKQILDVHEADHVIEIAFVHGQPRKAGHRHGAQHFLGRRVDVHRVQIDPRPHDVAHRAVAKPQRAECQLLFERLDDAFGRAGIDQMLDVVERHGWLAVGAQSAAATKRCWSKCP